VFSQKRSPNSEQEEFFSEEGTFIRVALRKKKICLLEKTSFYLEGKSILEKKTIFVKKRPFFLYERLHF